MPCEDIELRLQNLRSQRRTLHDGLEMILSDKVKKEMEEQIASLDAQITVEQRNLNECRAEENCEDGTSDNPQPFYGRVEKIHCIKAGKDAILSKKGQDPYLLIATVDMLAVLELLELPNPIVGNIPINIHKPALNCFLVGPFFSVKDGDYRYPSADTSTFWDLNGERRIINNPEDVVFLVALMENDDSSPDALRGAVNTSLQVTIWEHLGSDYGTFSDALVSSMTGSIETFKGAGASVGKLNFDDRLGAVLQLHLTAHDICMINESGHLEKSLTFTHYKNDDVNDTIQDQYSVTFEFEV